MQIYYINLARRTDRRQFMEGQFGRLGLSATRIEALSPADLTEAERDRPIDPTSGVVLPEASLCCVLGHLRAMDAMLANGTPWSLILEDDAVLSASLPAFLAAFDASPPVANLVRIEAATKAHLTLSRQDTIVGGLPLHRYTGWDNGAAGYIISREAAHTVQADKTVTITDIDMSMFHDSSPLCRRLKPLQANPGLCIQADTLGDGAPHASSDLQRSRQGQRLSPWQNFARVFNRDVIQASRKAWWRFALGGTRTRILFRPD